MSSRKSINESEGSSSGLYGFGDSSNSISYSEPFSALQSKFDLINSHQERLSKAQDNLGNIVQKGKRVAAMAAGQEVEEDEEDEREEIEGDREEEEEQDRDRDPSQKSRRQKLREEMDEEQFTSLQDNHKEFRDQRRQSYDDFGDDGYGGTKKKKKKKDQDETLQSRVIKEQVFAAPLIKQPKKSSWDKVPLRLKLFFQLFFDCLSAALAISAISLWTSPNYEFTDIVNDFSSAPIVDIQLIPSSQSCASSYYQLVGTFLTVGSICDCGSDNIQLGACSSSDSSCTNVSPISSFSLPIWRYYKICVMPHPSGTAVNAANRYGKCNTTNWSYCSSPSSSNPICVPTGTPCPLTSFSIVVGGPLQCPNGTIAKKAFSSSSDSRYLCTSTTGDVPLVDIAITLGGKCFANETFQPFSDQNLQQGTSAGSVDLTYTPNACSDSGYDLRYNDIEIRQIGALYQDNLAAFNQLGMSLNQIDYWIHIPYPVFYKFQIRPELQYPLNCPSSRQDIINANGMLNTITSTQTGLAIISVLTELCVNFPWIVWSCTKGYKTYSKKTALFLMKAILVIAGSTVSTVLICTSLFTIYQSRSILQTAVDQNCGDPQTQLIFQNYSDSLFQTLWMDAVVLAWNVILISNELRLMITLPQGRAFRMKSYELAPTQIEMRETQRINFNDDADDHQEAVPPEKYFDPDAFGPAPSKNFPVSTSMEIEIPGRASESRY